jgi:hypothetical protein
MTRQNGPAKQVALPDQITLVAALRASRAASPAKQVALPDQITYDMVTQALKALGLERGNSAHVEIAGDEVTVAVAPAGGYGSIRRVYPVNAGPVRFVPKEE